MDDTTNDGENCRTCRFWRSLERGDEDADDESGDCRRRAPVIVAKKITHFCEGWGFPMTPAAEWCGEYEARKPLPMATPTESTEPTRG